MKGGWRNIVICGCLLLAPVWLRAQSAPAASDGAIRLSLIFEQFYSTQGLPDDRVRSLFQDKKGFLWVGTVNGIAKYDGYSFKKYYRSEVNSSLSGNWAFAMAEDSLDNIWIATRQGISKLSQRTEKITSYLAGEGSGLTDNRVNTLQFDTLGRLWAGTRKGISIFHPATGAFTALTAYPFNGNIGKIIRAAGNFLWIATPAGLVHYNTRSEKYDLFPFTFKANPYGDLVWGMVEANNSVYIATARNGLLRFSPSTKTFEQVPGISGQELFDITKSKAGDLWIATGQGLARMKDMGAQQPMVEWYHSNASNKKSISNDNVFRVLVDRANILWCGTEFGLNKLDLNLLSFRYFSFREADSRNQVRSIGGDRQVIWLGTFAAGVYRYDLQTGHTTHFDFEKGSPYNALRSLYVGNDNTVLAGTLEGLVTIKNGKTLPLPGPFSQYTIFAIMTDRHSNRWIGTTHGLYKITPSGEISTFLQGADYIRALLEDRQGNIWIGFENSGLGYMDPASGTFTNVTGIVGSTVYTLLEYPAGTIWAGSESGLSKIEPSGKVRSFTQEQGLPERAVNGILTDSAGHLWISTIRGLSKMDIQRETFVNYLPAFNFNYNSYQAVDAGQLRFGTTDGFVSFNPADIAADVPPPTMVLSGLRLFNREVEIGNVYQEDTILRQSILYTEDITFHHRNNVFTIGFTALSFTDPGKTGYLYQLDGFDKDWIKTGSDNRSATYTNLDPGHYTFRVKALSSTGQWTSERELYITILPPPWKTWWAWCLYILFVLAIIYGINRYWLLQSKQRQKIRFAQQEKEQIRQLDELKMRFFTDISHEFRTPLSLIAGPAEDLASTTSLNGSLKEKAALIQRNAKKLLNLLEELMTFQKLDQGKLQLQKVEADIVPLVTTICQGFEPLAERKRIHLRCLCEMTALSLSIDPARIEMIINNLIYNALKFTPAGGAVTVHCYREKEEVRIAVEDNGKGIAPEELPHLFERFHQGGGQEAGGTGIGLSLSKNLAVLHGGNIIVTSIPAVKTVFTLILPLLTQEDTPAAAGPGIIPATVQASADLPEENTALAGQQELLIVEDNPEMLDYLESVFKDRYHVSKAINGRQALDLIQGRDPDIIISDIMMEGMDGLALCKAIKHDIHTSHIPFILLTARSAIEKQIEGFNVGADDYIPKPFHPELLRLRVARLLETRQRLIEKYSLQPIIPENIARNPLDEAFMQQVLDYVHAHMDEEELSVEALGSAVAMSRSNLFRKIKAITGQTPIELIYHIRLTRAMELLLERRHSITDIAWQVGFKTASSFTKSFKKKFGKSPTDYLDSILAGQ